MSLSRLLFTLLQPVRTIFDLFPCRTRCGALCLPKLPCFYQSVAYAIDAVDDVDIAAGTWPSDNTAVASIMHRGQRHDLHFVGADIFYTGNARRDRAVNCCGKLYIGRGTNRKTWASRDCGPNVCDV